MHANPLPASPEGCGGMLRSGDRVQWGKASKGRDLRGAPEAVGQAVGGGCQSGWGRLLSVTNAIEAGTRRQGEWLGIGWPPWRGGGGALPPSNASLSVAHDAAPSPSQVTSINK